MSLTYSEIQETALSVDSYLFLHLLLGDTLSMGQSYISGHLGLYFQGYFIKRAEGRVCCPFSIIKITYLFGQRRGSFLCCPLWKTEVSLIQDFSAVTQIHRVHQIHLDSLSIGYCRCKKCVHILDFMSSWLNDLFIIMKVLSSLYDFIKHCIIVYSSSDISMVTLAFLELVFTLYITCPVFKVKPMFYR